MKIRALLPVAAAGMLLGAANPAAALDIYPSIAHWDTFENSALDADDIADIISGDITLSEPLNLLYKFEVDGANEVGSYAGSYASDVQGNGGTIEYVGGPSIVCGICVLVVKDGNSEPAQYLFDLAALAWDGVEDLVLSGFWPRREDAISHVAIWGVPQASVPEPGALGLLGFSLLVLGGMRRFGRRRA
jgi:hypothetical protein